MLTKRLITTVATTVVVITAPVASAFAQHTFSREASYCTATLAARQRSAKIALRASPGTKYRALGYGLVGDRVYVLVNPGAAPELHARQDSQGYTWHRVGFPGSGAKGWIRQDFLRIKCTTSEE
jgi:hypothetical protein